MNSSQLMIDSPIWTEKLFFSNHSCSSCRRQINQVEMNSSQLMLYSPIWTENWHSCLPQWIAHTNLCQFINSKFYTFSSLHVTNRISLTRTSPNMLIAVPMLYLPHYQNQVQAQHITRERKKADFAQHLEAKVVGSATGSR